MGGLFPVKRATPQLHLFQARSDVRPLNNLQRLPSLARRAPFCLIYAEGGSERTREHAREVGRGQAGAWAQPVGGLAAGEGKRTRVSSSAAFSSARRRPAHFIPLFFSFSCHSLPSSISAGTGLPSLSSSSSSSIPSRAKSGVVVEASST